MTYIENTSPEIDLAENHINVQVFRLLEDLEAVGQTSNPRGLQTREANLATLDIDPYYSVMNFKPRAFNWKYFAGELAWYLQGDPSIEFINNFSSFWKGITPNGIANSNYGWLLFGPHPSTIGQNSNMSKEVNQLEWVFNSLAKDQNTRQAVAFFNSPYFQYEGNKDFVCTMYINFWIRKNHLDMKVQMRSNDIYFGLTYDAPWFATLHQSMYLNLKNLYPDLRMGTYYHSADNIHYYERHFKLTDEILESGLDSSVKLVLREPLFRFEQNLEGLYKMYISETAQSYVQMVKDVVSEKRDDSFNDQTYWKSTLEYLYNIT